MYFILSHILSELITSHEHKSLLHLWLQFCYLIVSPQLQIIDVPMSNIYISRTEDVPAYDKCQGLGLFCREWTHYTTGSRRKTKWYSFCFSYQSGFIFLNKSICLWTASELSHSFSSYSKSEQPKKALCSFLWHWWGLEVDMQYIHLTPSTSPL